MTAAQVPVAIAHAVDERDEQKCVRCGVWIEGNGSRHHRQRRAVGGHIRPNLILLCGSGTTGCHGWAHANPALARLAGYIVASWVADVAGVPVLVAAAGDLAGSRMVWMLLTVEGDRNPIDTLEAIERMDEMGLTADAVGTAVALIRAMPGVVDLNAPR